MPFGQVSARLQRIVRQTAKQVSKPVELEIVGEDIPVDAELLERDGLYARLYKMQKAEEAVA